MKRSEYEAKLNKYEEEIQEIQKCIEELRKIEIEEDGVWKPKLEEKYWYINNNSFPYKDTWVDTYVDDCRFDIGNVFKTQEDAEFQVERLKVITKLKQFSHEFTYGYRNFYINLSNGDTLSYNYRSNVMVQGVIYFESEEKVNEAIEAVGEDRIKKYLFGVE